jgi:hypothetical protein
VAGTATAVSGSVARHQDNKQAEQQQQAMADQAAVDNQAQIQDLQSQVSDMQAQQAQAAPAPAPAPQPAAAAAAPPTDLVAQLQQLTQLKNAGALSDEEFQEAKTKLLGS